MPHDNYLRVIPHFLGTGLIPGAGLAGAVAGEHLTGSPYGGAAGAGLGAGLLAAGLAPGGDSLRTGIFSGLGAAGGSMLTSGIKNPFLRGLATLASVPMGSLLGRSIADSSRGTAHDAYAAIGKDAHKTGSEHAAELFGIKVAADIVDPDSLSAFRRSGNIDQAWTTNSELGNSSLGNPGMSNAPLTPSLGNLSTAMQWKSVDEGMKLSFIAPPVKPRPPRPRAMTSAAVSGSRRSLGAPTATGNPAAGSVGVGARTKGPTHSITDATVIQPRPAVLPGLSGGVQAPKSSPATQVANQVSAASLTEQVKNHATLGGTGGTGGGAPSMTAPTLPVPGLPSGATTNKQGEFHLKGVDRSAAPPPDALPPDAIRPDNGSSRIGTNFDLPRLGTSDAVSRAFNDLNNAPKNQDFLNEMNQGLIGAGP